MNVLTRFVLDHKRLVLGFWLAVTIAAFAAIGPAGSALSQQFNVPGREGFETNQELAAIYGNGGDVAPIVPVVKLPQGTTVDSPGVSGQLDAALAKVEAALPGARTASYASTRDRAFVSDDGRTTFALVYIPAKGGVDPGQEEARAAQAALAGVTVGGSRVEVTGLDALRASAGENEGSGTGVLLGTLLAALGALLVLIFVFRSFMAIVPLLMALVAIPTTFLLVWPVAAVTDVSVIVQFLVALIGLGIAIDYALLVVVRWREERQQPDMTNEGAVRNAMQHAGSAVVFSGTTVAISLLALLAVPIPALRSIGIAGLMIALVSVAVAITLLPVVLATIGPKLDWPRNRRDARASRGWSAWARLIVRYRWLAAATSTAVLVALVVAASSIQLGNPRADSLAQEGPARVGLENLEDSGIGTGPLSPFDALVRSGDPDAVADSLAQVDGVQSAAAPADWRRGGTALVTVIPTEDGNSPAGRATLDRLRAATHTLPAEVTIGGEAAQGADFLDAVYGNFPLLIGLIAVLTFILLARAFRSLILPLKAVLLNLLSVAAAWGLIVLVWQKGFGSDEIWGIEATHAINVRAADRRLRLPLRRLDGLPGLHHQPDAGGIRPHRIDRGGRRRGDRPHRPPRHERRADPRPLVRRLRRPAGHGSQDLRDRARRRNPDRRDDHPRRPRARRGRSLRPLELVAPGLGRAHPPRRTVARGAGGNPRPRPAAGVDTCVGREGPPDVLGGPSGVAAAQLGLDGLEPDAARGEERVGMEDDVRDLLDQALVGLAGSGKRRLEPFLADLARSERRVVEQRHDVRALRPVLRALLDPAPQPGREARLRACVAGRTRRVDAEQDRVAVAVVPHLLDRHRVPRRGALAPVVLARAAPEPRLAALARAPERLGVHPGEHQDAIRLGVLHDRRCQRTFHPASFSSRFSSGSRSGRSCTIEAISAASAPASNASAR